MDTPKKNETPTLPPPGEYPDNAQRVICRGNVHTHATRRDIPAARIK
jgi:hypothetical protein